jgi:hypothetical protein
VTVGTSGCRAVPFIDSYQLSVPASCPYIRTHRYQVPSEGTFTPKVAVPAGDVALPFGVPAGVSM